MIFLRSRFRFMLAIGTTVVIVCLASACQDTAMPPESESVPRALDPTWTVEGRALLSADLNFRLLAPTGWTWEEDLSVRTPTDHRYGFMARSGPRIFFRVIVHGRDLYENTEASVSEHLDGVVAGVEKSGAHVVNMDYRSRPISAGRGYSYSYDIQLPHGTARANGYLLAADRVYIFHYVSRARENISAFDEFIESFELLRPPSRGTAPR